MRSIRETIALALVVSAALAPGVAHGQSAELPEIIPRGLPRAGEPRGPSPADDLSPSVVARPGQESGRLDDVEGKDSAAREIGRGILYVPKLAFGVAMTPARGTVYLADRYHVSERARRWFFNQEETFGAFPVAGWDSGFGPNIGARFIAKNVFDRKEQIDGKAVVGWASRATVMARFMSGDHLGEHLTLGLEVIYDRNPAERFYGFGNGSELDPRDDMLIDPNIDNRAVETRFFERQARASAALDIRPYDGFHIRPGVTVADVETSSDISSRLNEPAIDEQYDVMAITGFPGYQIGYGELELRLDTRRRWDEFESKGMPSKGWLVSAFAGRALVDVGEDYFRYGADIHRLFHIGMGPRVISLRFHMEGVTGDRDEVPFTELPTLGGPTFLRGYNLERFRDRLAAVASAEYAWDLSEGMGASLFVDAGRVYPGLDELSLDNMRVGFGVGVQAHTSSLFLARAQLASSIDGGVFLNLAFEPAFEPQLRVRSR